MEREDNIHKRQEHLEDELEQLDAPQHDEQDDASSNSPAQRAQQRQVEMEETGQENPG